MLVVEQAALVTSLQGGSIVALAHTTRHLWAQGLLSLSRHLDQQRRNEVELEGEAGSSSLVPG